MCESVCVGARESERKRESVGCMGRDEFEGKQGSMTLDLREIERNINISINDDGVQQ